MQVLSRPSLTNNTPPCGLPMNDDNELVAHKWVRLLADTSAHGVWSKDGYCCRAEDLPVSSGLIDRIQHWQNWYDAYENEWGLFKGDVEAFAVEGLALAKAVKAALPDWTVVYWDAAASERAGKDAERRVYEYEV
jgi:hypothetical protein